MRGQAISEKLMPLFRGRKRGQNAVEFLMTYAWAILVVAIVIAVLGYLGLPYLSSSEPERCSFPAGSLQCNQLTLERGSDGTVAIRDVNITNGFNKELHVCNVRCSAQATGANGLPLVPAGSVTACGANADTIKPGESKVRSQAIRCYDSSGEFAQVAVGTLYHGSIYLAYSYADETSGSARIAVADAVSRVQKG
ncbi:MAG: hypothetical protein WC759_03535 [Candidatus Micrarchaeia archaeon]|jgi:hypothetical protein